jgi:hypothetical protein
MRRRPYGTPFIFWGAAFPTLNHPVDEDLSTGTPGKRGANKHCAYGAGVVTMPDGSSGVRGGISGMPDGSYGDAGAEVP